MSLFQYPNVNEGITTNTAGPQFQINTFNPQANSQPLPQGPTNPLYPAQSMGWYNVLQPIGNAMGAAVGGNPGLEQSMNEAVQPSRENIRAYEYRTRMNHNLAQNAATYSTPMDLLKGTSAWNGSANGDFLSALQAGKVSPNYFDPTAVSMYQGLSRFASQLPGMFGNAAQSFSNGMSNWSHNALGGGMAGGFGTGKNQRGDDYLQAAYNNLVNGMNANYLL